MVMVAAANVVLAQGKVTGRVVENSGAAVEYATVALLKTV